MRELKNLNFKVDKEVIQKIERLSRELKISKSGVVRLAIIFLEKNLLERPGENYG